VNTRKKRAREIQAAIGQILYLDWDPLQLSGIAPHEYDSYVGEIYRILAISRSEDALIECLGSRSRVVDRRHLCSVAQKLLALDVEL
jgi:hypothetical protein